MPVYKNTHYNRIAGRVGKTYGKKKTHKMPGGVEMTGATHTASSKPVKKKIYYIKKDSIK